MLKSSFLEILRTLNNEELKKFDDFLKSPYHNKISNIVKLYSEVKKYYPDFNSPDLDKEIIWKKLFPGKEYNYGTMKNLIHELSKLSQKFIVLEDFDRYKLGKEEFLINCLNERNISKLFNVKINDLEREYSVDTFNKEEFFANDFYAIMSKILWIKIYHNRSNAINSETEKDITESSAMFIYSFLIYLYKYYNNIKVDSLEKNFSLDKNILAVFLKEISPEIIEKLLAIVKGYSERDYRIMNVFWNMSKTHQDKSSVKNYLEFKKSLYDNVNILSRWDARDLFASIGSSLTNLKTTEIDIDKEIFDNFETMLKTGIIFKRDGTLATMDFYLYLLRAFYAGDYIAITKFTDKYLNKIPKDSKEYYNNISKAFLLFGESKFNEALEKISVYEHPSFITKIRMKEFKAKCLYELNEFENFISEHKSLYHFLKNNKFLSSKTKSDLKDIFDRIYKMFRLKEKFDLYEFKKLKKEISEIPLIHASWFNQKIANIGDGKTKV